MIIGIGSDLVNVERIGEMLEKHGVRFVKRLFTPAEQAKAKQQKKSVEIYAKRFAAKEACAKALGTGVHRGVYFKDMGVTNLSSGQPTMKLTGGALKHLKKLTPKGMKAKVHLSLTDDILWAQAFVVIEALPE